MKTLLIAALFLLLLVASSHSTPTQSSMVSASDQNFRDVNVVGRKGGGGGGGHGGGHGGRSGGRGGRSRGYTSVVPLYVAGAGAHNLNNNHHHGKSSGSFNRIGVAHVAFSTLASFAFLFA